MSLRRWTTLIVSVGLLWLTAPAECVALAATQEIVPIAPLPSPVNSRVLAGAAALAIGGLLSLLFVYRRRPYIVYWITSWLLIAVSMFLVAPSYTQKQVSYVAFGLSQFISVVAALVFVISADAYRMRPRLRRTYVMVLLPIFIWFALAPIALGPRSVFAPGHLLIAGGLAGAGFAHLLLLRRAWLLGAAVVGTAFLVLASTNVWMALAVVEPGDVQVTKGLYISMALYLVTALGMQLMTFEDMTYELRRTNRRLQRAQSELRMMVITDPLTGCRNRRFFDEVIGRELQRHRRYETPLSLLFVDVDNFKAVNDTLGHDAGDRVLRHVADFLRRNIREADYVFRWGGDEFIALLSCTEDEALRRGLALQREFVRWKPDKGIPADVGLSVGVAEVRLDTRDVMASVRTADERMYANKRAAR
jgi:diguanylate cyclase (GGDEF)-like protein